MRPVPLFIPVLLILSVSAGCDRQSDQIQVNAVPKLPRPVSAAMQPPATAPAGDPHAPPSADLPIKWTVPTGWKELPGDGQMRVATLLVNTDPKVELTVIPLSGASGGLAANVNRWEGQLGLKSTPPADVPKLVKQVEVSGHQVDVVELVGAESANPRQRMLAAAVQHDGRTWFFKMSGPDAVVAAQKANFDAFVKSLKFGSSEEQEKLEERAEPPLDPAQGQRQPAGADAGDATYDVPEGWTKDQPKPMRVVSFTAGPAGKTAEMIVTRFPSTGTGGYLDNVNRWRTQAGLAPIQQGDQQPSKTVTVGGVEGALFDLTGPEKRLLVAWVPVGQQWWFFKFAGPTDVVTQQQPAFDRFLKSVRFTGGAEGAGGPKPAQ